MEHSAEGGPAMDALSHGCPYATVDLFEDGKNANFAMARVGR